MAAVTIEQLKWTVVGFYPEADYSRAAAWTEAPDADAAEEKVVAENQDFAAVAVFEGHLHAKDGRWSVNFGDEQRDDD